MFWLFLTQKKANKEKTVMTLTAELTFQKILSSIELDSDCVDCRTERFDKILWDFEEKFVDVTTEHSFQKKNVYFKI